MAQHIQIQNNFYNFGSGQQHPPRQQQEGLHMPPISHQMQGQHMKNLELNPHPQNQPMDQLSQMSPAEIGDEGQKSQIQISKINTSAINQYSNLNNGHMQQAQMVKQNPKNKQSNSQQKYQGQDLKMMKQKLKDGNLFNGNPTGQSRSQSLQQLERRYTDSSSEKKSEQMTIDDAYFKNGKNQPCSAFHQLSGEELRKELFYNQKHGAKAYLEYREMMMMYQAEIKKRWNGRAQIKEAFVFPRIKEPSPVIIAPRVTQAEWIAPKQMKINQSQTLASIHTKVENNNLSQKQIKTPSQGRIQYSANTQSQEQIKQSQSINVLSKFGTPSTAALQTFHSNVSAKSNLAKNNNNSHLKSSAQNLNVQNMYLEQLYDETKKQSAKQQSQPKHKHGKSSLDLMKLQLQEMVNIRKKINTSGVNQSKVGLKVNHYDSQSKKSQRSNRNQIRSDQVQSLLVKNPNNIIIKKMEKVQGGGRTLQAPEEDNKSSYRHKKNYLSQNNVVNNPNTTNKASPMKENIQNYPSITTQKENEKITLQLTTKSAITAQNFSKQQQKQPGNFLANVQQNSSSQQNKELFNSQQKAIQQLNENIKTSDSSPNIQSKLVKQRKLTYIKPVNYRNDQEAKLSDNYRTSSANNKRKNTHLTSASYDKTPSAKLPNQQSMGSLNNFNENQIVLSQSRFEKKTQNTQLNYQYQNQSSKKTNDNLPESQKNQRMFLEKLKKININRQTEKPSTKKMKNLGKSQENFIESFINDEENKESTFKIKNLDGRYNDISLIPEAWKESDYTASHNQTGHHQETAQTFKTLQSYQNDSLNTSIQGKPIGIAQNAKSSFDQQAKSKMLYNLYSDQQLHTEQALVQKRKKSLNKKTSVENLIQAQLQSNHIPTTDLMSQHVHAKSLQSLEQKYVQQEQQYGNKIQPTTQYQSISMKNLNGGRGVKQNIIGNKQYQAKNKMFSSNQIIKGKLQKSIKIYKPNQIIQSDTQLKNQMVTLCMNNANYLRMNEQEQQSRNYSNITSSQFYTKQNNTSMTNQKKQGASSLVRDNSQNSIGGYSAQAITHQNNGSINGISLSPFKQNSQKMAQIQGKSFDVNMSQIHQARANQHQSHLDTYNMARPQSRHKKNVRGQNY